MFYNAFPHQVATVYFSFHYYFRNYFAPIHSYNNIYLIIDGPVKKCTINSQFIIFITYIGNQQGIGGPLIKPKSKIAGRIAEGALP